MGGNFRSRDYLPPAFEVTDALSGTPWSRSALEAPESVEENPIYLRYLELRDATEARTATDEQVSQYEDIQNKLSRLYKGAYHPCGVNTRSEDCLKAYALDQTRHLLKKGLSPREMEFVVGLKAFLKAQLTAQGLEIQSKIDCVNAALANGGVLSKTLEDPDVAARCESILNTDLREMVKGYREVRVYLGLMQATPRMQVTPQKTPRGDAWDGTYCGRFAEPLSIDGTSLCTERIGEILRLDPEHTVVDNQFRKINQALEKLDIYEDLPEVPRLTPLTLQEVAIAATFYREAYVQGAQIAGNYQPGAWEEVSKLNRGEELKESGRRRKQYIQTKTAQDWAMYLNAQRFQGKIGALTNIVLPQGSELRTDETTDTAEKRYTDWLQRYPTIVFMEPELEKVKKVDCTQSITVGSLKVMAPQLCEAYVAKMKGKRNPIVQPKFFERNSDGDILNHKPILEVAKKAFQKSQAVHELMLQRFDRDYDTQKLLTEMKSGQVLEMNDIQKWLPLMANEFAVKGFIEIEPEYKAVSERLHKEFESSELKKMLWDLAGAVGIGVGCIALLGAVKFMPLVCLVGGGLGVNSYFYHTGYSRYQDTFIRYFSSTSGDLRLMDLEVVEAEDFGMFLEAAFFGMGLESGRILMAGKKSWGDLIHYSQFFKQSFSRAEP